MLPALVGEDTALCPGCHRPLRDLGMRPSEAELKVIVDDRPLARFTVRQGEMVAFGRLILPNTAELAELAREGVFAGVGRVYRPAHQRQGALPCARSMTGTRSPCSIGTLKSAASGASASCGTRKALPPSAFATPC